MPAFTAPPAMPPPAALAGPLLRHHRQPRAGLPFLGRFTLAAARVHEFCGPARRMLALMAARGTTGPVLWLRPGWLPERLFPDGVQPVIAPGRLIFVTPARPADLLWCFEQALRAGAAALVVAELPEPPGLTPVRRLNLAAEAGAASGPVVPTGLILTPGEGGAPGVESRWHIAPCHGPGTTCWRLDLRRARDMPPQGWQITATAGNPAAGPGAMTGGQNAAAEGTARFTLARLRDPEAQATLAETAGVAGVGTEATGAGDEESPDATAKSL